MENFPRKVLPQLLSKLSYLLEISLGSYLPSKTLSTSNLITNENKQKSPITQGKRKPLASNLVTCASDRCITVAKALINKWDMLNSTRGHENFISHNRTEHLKVQKKTKPNKTNLKCSFTLQLNPLHTVACFLQDY